MNSIYNHSSSTFNASSGILPREIGLGAAWTIGVVGVTAKAELKSLARFAAKVAHGGGSAEFVNI